mgnify:FL=1|jgi:hypothetical protein
MCGCNRSKAKSFNQRRNTRLASGRSTEPNIQANIKPKTQGVSQERRDIEKRRRQIIRKTFGK